MGSKVVYVHKLGRMPYLATWELQKRTAMQVLNNIRCGRDPGHRLLLVEHDPGETRYDDSRSYTENRKLIFR